MLNYLFAGVGGFFGCMFRYKIDGQITAAIDSEFPFGVFFVNIIGAFLLGIVTKNQVSLNYYALFGDGFLGAFTTFSSFMYKTLELANNKKHKHAFAYLFLSIIVGIVFYFLGYSIV